MASPTAEPLPPTRPRALRAVIDSCVFARRAWLDAIIDSARVGHLVPFWSPCIIAETNRLLTWLWLKRHAGPMNDAAWRRLSRDAHRWFEIMSTVFHLVDDRPPLVPMWTAGPADPHDAPIWTAAVRASADCVVTDNLADAPPADDRGLHIYAGVAYIVPTEFVLLLDLWGRFLTTGELPLGPTLMDAAPPSTGALPGAGSVLSPGVVNWLRSLVQQLTSAEDTG